MSFEQLDDLGQAGVALALAGGLMGVTPQIERLLYFGPGWLGHLGLTLLGGLVVAGAVLAIRGYAAVGGLLAGAPGLALVILGPTTAGVLGLVGGLVLFLLGGERTTEFPSGSLRQGTADR